MTNRMHKQAYLQGLRGITAAMMLGLLAQSQAFSEPTHASARSAQPPLRMGLMPFLTPSLLFKRFQPMIEYLETTLQRPVIAVTAPDFQTYINRIEQGEYDVFLAAPHISAYMEQQHQSRRLAGFDRNLQGYFVVHKDSDIYRLEQLKNRELAMPDPLAIISLLGEWRLAEHNLQLGWDVRSHNTTHNNALLLVANKRMAGAVIGVSTFENTPESVKSKLRVLTETAAVPHMMFHSRANLAESEYQNLKASLLRFTAQGAGKTFFHDAAFGDMAPISDQEILRLTRLVEILEQRLD